MRWSYIISRVVTLAVIWAAVFFGMDPLIKWAVRKAAQSATHAKVDIGSLKTKLFPPSVAITGVQVADKAEPFKNIFEFQSLALAVEGGPLLEKKFIVKEAALDGLRFNTKRATSGALPVPKEEKPSVVSAKLDELKQAGQGFALSRFADIKSGAAASLQVSAESLSSLKAGEEIKKEIDAESAGLQDQLKSLNAEGRINAIKSKLAAVEQEGSLLKKLEAAKSLKQEVDSLRAELDAAKTRAAGAFAKSKDSLRRLDDARKHDIDEAMKQLKLPSLDAKSITYYLLGPAVAGKTEKALEWYGIVKKYMPAGKAEARAKEAARRGMVIAFPKEKTYPAFAIKHMRLAGSYEPPGSQPVQFSGTVEGITTQPAVYGKPLAAAIDGESGGLKIHLLAELDRTAEIAKDSFNFSFGRFALADYQAGRADSVLLSVKGGSGDVKGGITVSGGKLNGRIAYKAEGVAASAAVPAGGEAMKALQGALDSAMSGLREITVSLALSGDISAPGIDFESNVGPAVAEGVKGALGRQIQEYRKAVESRVDSEIQGMRARLEGDLASKQKELLGRLNTEQGAVSGLQSELQKKIQSSAGSAIPTRLNLPKIKF